MIPKVIHYCWFGGAPLPELTQMCIASWKKYCPDYEIRQWNESNFDVNFCDFAKEAFQAKKWAFLSDCARLKIIYQEGGIYLDTDVELLKSLDSLLEHACYLAEETSGFINTGLGFGAEKGNPVIGELLQQYNGHFQLAEGIFDSVPCPRKNTEPFYQYGYKPGGTEIWTAENVTVYPAEYFCPMNYDTGSTKITSNTYSIHHFLALWKPDDVKELEKILSEIKSHSSKPLAFLKGQSIQYRFYKGKGEVRSFPEFVVKKIRKKWVEKKNGIYWQRIPKSGSLLCRKSKGR